jgi:hypothetical protein
MARPRALTQLKIPVGRSPLPSDVQALLREASRRIDRFLRSHHCIAAFVPSDFRATYAALQALVEADVAPGELFCEWGSGFGVVTCLAAMLGFDARGIEIEPELVHAAQELADDFDLPVEFHHGSFIPPGGEHYLSLGSGFSGLTPTEGHAHEDLGLAPEDFDVIFAYPWPDEEQSIEDLFAHYAGAGAVLVTYHGMGVPRLRQKARGRRR